MISRLRHIALGAAASFSLVACLLIWLPVALPIERLIAVTAVEALLYLLIGFIILSDEEFDTRSVLYLAATGLTARLALLMHEPIASGEIFRYIWDGRLLAHGLNPYLYTPSAPPDGFSINSIPGSIPFPDSNTAYPPIAQGFFALGWMVFGNSVFAIKSLIIIAEIASLIFIYKILRLLGRPLKYMLLYALCPLPILFFALEGHYEAIFFPFLLGFIYLFIKKRNAFSAAMLGLASGGNIFPMLSTPAAFASSRRLGEGLQYVTIPIILLVLSYFPFAGAVEPRSMSVFPSPPYANALFFNIFQNFLSANHALIFCLGCILLATAIISLIRTEIYIKIYYIFLFYLLFSPALLPWHAAWIAVLLPIVPRMSGIFLAALTGLSVYIFRDYLYFGEWAEDKLFVYIEYAPILLALLIELLLRNRK
ncbi:MAG: hypothetical protein ACLFQX_05260 [Candidatus Kapaibacterium sp.]